MFFRIFIFITALNFLFSQGNEENYIFTSEEVQSIRNSILELENADSLNKEIILSLEQNIQFYKEKQQNDSLLISLQIEKIDILDQRILLYKDLVKEVEPKWYENKWIWFGLGIIATSSSIKLASEIVD